MKKLLMFLALTFLLTACVKIDVQGDIEPKDPEIKDEVVAPVSPEAPNDEPIEEPPVIFAEEPVPVPVEPEPVPVETLEPDSQVETVKLRGAALGSVDMTDYGDEYRYMSFDEAQALTGGKLYLFKEKHNEYWNGYITPSGKLVYIDPRIFEQLPEGTVDFAVDWSHPENSAAPVNFRTEDYRMPDGLISLETSNIVVSDVKYDLYVDMCSSMDAYDPYEVFCCYGVAMEGTVSYDYGFKVNSEDYKGMTLKCTVTDPDGKVNVYSGSTDGVVSVESRVRDVASIDWLTWNVVAEIVDDDGNVVYTESFMYKEYEDFANSIEFAIPMQ
ncbi:MAG: hypothetical protein E7481_07135 [Ruminococcaceae bacterium]|nr:hypothetical protein [Oscillospiraceae bacterium]